MNLRCLTRIFSGEYFARRAECARLAAAPGILVMIKNGFAMAVALLALTFKVGAWDYEGHHMVNELALASLPKDFGGFKLTPAIKQRIEYLSGEPDRWRNVPDLGLRHVNGPDHYFDLEDVKLCSLTPETLPLLRYDFVAAIALARAA